MPPSVLLIEDDDRVRRALRLALEDEGFSVDEAADGQRGLRRLAARPDIVLLDVMLPDTDGFDVCRSIRRLSDVPVIMVTARTGSQDIVAGLEAGADDYVTKPLVAKELSARIRALLRRVALTGDNGSPPRRITVGELVIELEQGLVSRRGEPVPLTRTEFRLLAELAAAEGRVRTREQLLDTVWGYGYFGDNRLVDVHIARLRAKVEPDPAHPTHVITARGIGYRLAL